jgi:hypothetical protein
VNQRVLGTIESRLAGVAVERRLLNAARPNHPDVQVLTAAQAVLERRRAELRSLLVGTNAPGSPFRRCCRDSVSGQPNGR